MIKLNAWRLVGMSDYLKVLIVTKKFYAKQK